MRKILGAFEVFLGVFEKTKEKKDRELVEDYIGIFCRNPFYVSAMQSLSGVVLWDEVLF